MLTMTPAQRACAIGLVLSLAAPLGALAQVPGSTTEDSVVYNIEGSSELMFLDESGPVELARLADGEELTRSWSPRPGGLASCPASPSPFRSCSSGTSGS